MAKTPDLFDQSSGSSKGYTAKDIEVLEGLEPVRRRPGMYVGGTDEAPCITWRPKSSTMRWTKRWPDTPPGSSSNWKLATY